MAFNKMMVYFKAYIQSWWFYPGGVLLQIFGTRVQHTKKKWTQSDLSFCKNEGSKKLILMEKEVNLIENEGKIDTKCLKSLR